MGDLFEREQQVCNDAAARAEEMVFSGGVCDAAVYVELAKEYARLLRQFRRIMKMSDTTTIRLNESNLDLKDKAHSDPLTGLYNRRFMEESLERNIRTLSRSGGMLSILMMDVDFFKKFNDTYGHSAGDECLKAVAGALKSAVAREGDFAARYGGEEFIVVLPNTDEAGACVVAEKLLRAVRDLRIPHEKNYASPCVSISIGAATGVVDHSRRPGEYIERADGALYLSKQNGRNRYTFHTAREGIQ
jgi:diguanylate cyclase (GGDEF)-like protein